MTPAKELPIVIEKSSDEVEQIIALVHASNLPEGTKHFVIGCILDFRQACVTNDSTIS